MIHVGTCSWTEKTLLQSGEFYPKSVNTAEARLKFYSSRFDTVEVDSSYYAIPDTKTVQLWADRSPNDFVFHIKVYGGLTGHGINPKSLPIDVVSELAQTEREKQLIYVTEKELLKHIADRFKEVLQPLKRTNKLGIILFQFPPWFQYKNSNLDYLLECKRLMGNFPIGVEFRHGSWLSPDKRASVIQFLREYGMVYITADEPQYGNLATVPFLPEVTGSIAYFRFHGKNKENWLKKGIETSLRFSYFYSDAELQEFIPAIKDTELSAKETYVMFNNCHGGFAVKNALKMKRDLERAY